MSFSARGLAARQLQDYRARAPGTFFGEVDYPSLTLEDVYAVQAEVARLRSAEGEPVAGYKVGATGAGVREQFGMDGPVRGFVYGTELYPSGVEISRASYANLAIEGELAVRLGDASEIVRVFPVIELHNYVLRSKTPNLQELIANNGVHAGVVLPTTEGAEWRGEEPLTGTLRVEINGRAVDEGAMSGVPGGPAGSVEWLGRHLEANDQEGTNLNLPLRDAAPCGRTGRVETSIKSVLEGGRAHAPQLRTYHRRPTRSRGRCASTAAAGPDRPAHRRRDHRE